MTKILVVDDDTNIRKMIKVTLEAENFKVKTVGSEEDCLKLFEEQKFDLLLLDQRLDGKGTDLYKLVKKKFPDTKVIFVSAVFGQDTELKELAIKEHLLVISKPFNTEELISVVKKVLFDKQKSFEN